MILEQIEQFLTLIRQCQALGIRAIHASTNQIILEMPYSSAIVGNPDSGAIHGGAITTLLDTAAGTAMFCSSEDIELCPTLDLRVDYMRPASPGMPVFAKASCYRQTSNILFMRCEAYQEDKTIAHGVASFMRMGDKGKAAMSMMNKLYANQLQDNLSFPPLYKTFKAPQCDGPLSSLMGEVVAGNSNAFLEAIPYARFIGFELHADSKSGKVFKLRMQESNLGNPLIPAIHGGVLGGFMELTGGCHLILSQSTPTYPKIIDFSLDYLRAGRHAETYASCEVTRQGGRVANVMIKAWQDNVDEPVALARAHFLLETMDRQI